MEKCVCVCGVTQRGSCPGFHLSTFTLRTQFMSCRDAHTTRTWYASLYLSPRVGQEREIFALKPSHGERVTRAFNVFTSALQLNVLSILYKLIRLACHMIWDTIFNILFTNDDCLFM